MISYEELGQIAWDAYAKAVGGKTFDGKPLPAWEGLGPAQRQGWIGAARAVAGKANELH